MDSEGLNSILVKDLHDRGLIEGCYINTISADAPEYGTLRINIDGEFRLGELSTFEKQNPALNKPFKLKAGFILLGARKLFLVNYWIVCGFIQGAA